MPKLYTQTRFNSICNCKSKSHPHFLKSFSKLNNFRYFIFLSVLSTITRIRPIADWWQIKTNHYFVQNTNFSIEEVRDSVFFGYLITQNDCQSNSGFVLYFQKCSLLIKPFLQKRSFWWLDVSTLQTSWK